MTNQVECAAQAGATAAELLTKELTAGQELVAGAWGWVVQHGLEFALNAAAALLILLAGGLAVKAMTAAARGALQRTKRVNELLEKFICSVVNKAGWAVVLMLALQRLGVNVGPLIAGLGVTGFILGFAFQESLGNLASGMMIALNQPFKVGDYVIAGGVEGSVLELNMMAAVLATADNKRVTVPNKTVWGGAITNFSALGKRRVDTVIGIAYGSDIAKAKAVALEAVKAIPGVLADPEPGVAVASLDDSAVTLAVRPWSSCADYWAVKDATQHKVKEAFDKAGIEIPFPQIDVHMAAK